MNDQSERASPGGGVKSKQIPLALPLQPPSYDRASYVVSSGNETALRAAEGWLTSDEPALIICGPRGAGKTHLANIVVRQKKAAFLTPAQLSAAAPPASFVVIDDIHQSNDPRTVLEALTSLFDARRRIILVGEGAPRDWAGGLKDLQTRLEAMPRAVLSEPDEDLIRAVMVKLFHDRQITVKPAIIDYVAPRIQRTFAAASAFVALADEAAMAAKGKVSLGIAQKIVENLSDGV